MKLKWMDSLERQNMNKPLTTIELDSLIKTNKEIEVYIENNVNEIDEGWIKLSSKNNYPLKSYAYIDNNNKFRVRRLLNIYWRPWLVEPTQEEKNSFKWNKIDKINKPIPCPFCNCGAPMEIKVTCVRNLYKGSSKCSNCDTEILLDGFLLSEEQVYQEIYRICGDK